MIAYFDCFSGISGDMTLGALIDLGVPLKFLKESFRAIALTDFDITVSSVDRHGIKAKSVNIQTNDNETSRNYTDIKSLIEQSPLSETVKKNSLKIFEKLANAESKIHGCAVDKVHFHEIGGIDAIADIVGSVLCLEYLDIKTVTASSLPLGTGFVSCGHGTLPVPAPATLEILKGVPVYGSGIACELVTPTGAAIISTLAESYGAIPDMTIEKTGYGSGTQEIQSAPNLLRIIAGTAGIHQFVSKKDTVIVIETCIDDMNPEIFGFVMDRLFEDGALDVYWIPVFMKKNRPGTIIQVLCSRNRKQAVINRILSETTSSGLRYYEVKRAVLARENITVKTSFGMISVKRITDPAGYIRVVPEYEVCKKIAIEKNIPIRVVYDTITKGNY